LEKDFYEETIGNWNKLANLYEDRFMDLRIYDASYDFFCDQLYGVQPRVLEIGSGPGIIANYLKKKRPNLHLVCTDAAEAMVDLAKKNVGNGEFFVMDARHLGQLNQVFDGIVVGFCLPYLAPKDAEKLIHNAADILAENGLLYLSFVAGDTEQSGYQTGSSGDRIYFYYHAKDKLLETLKDAGFGTPNVMTIPYEKSNGTPEEHLIIIAKKKYDL